MSFNIDSREETILCESAQHIFALAGGSTKTAARILLVVDRATGSSKLFDSFDSEGASWTGRDLNRLSNMDRLRGFIEAKIADNRDYWKVGMPEIQDCLKATDRLKTETAEKVLKSVTEDLPLEQVDAHLWWDYNATSTATSFALKSPTLPSVTESATCITVDPDRLPLHIDNTLQKRLRDHALLFDLYGITFEGRQNCTRKIQNANHDSQATHEDYRKSAASISSDLSTYKPPTYFRDQRLDEVRAACAAEIETAKETTIQAFLNTPETARAAPVPKPASQNGRRGD